MPSKLKALELVGYKTFASKTTFLFDGDITVIVGPNGSGKSNIADALRWVLGEQAYSLLRGKKTDDMIFVGSETRARASMASASLTLDNADGWLPIDFSEVVITRRAYRDGQNEYFINNQRVRLKDVNELLSKSGLAQRTYTVIGQGLVDTALTINSDERRKLFEEAAGIGLYRTRKEQSLRRLDTTNRNLERVKDILSELEPRLRSLKRQADKAKEFGQMRDDLREVLRLWYGFHWRKSQEDILKVHADSSSQEKNLNAAKTKQEHFTSELTDLREKINGLRGRLNSWHRQLAQIHSEREVTNRDIAVSDERQRGLINKDVSLNTEITRIQESLDLMSVRLVQADERLKAVEVEALEASNMAANAQQDLEGKIQGRKLLEEEENKLQIKIRELEQQNYQKRAKVQELESRSLVLEENKKERIEEKEKSAESIVSVQKELEKSEIEFQDSTGQLERTKEELQEVEGTVVSKKQEKDILTEERMALQTEDARNRAEMGVLDQAEKNLSGYTEGAKVLLEAVRKKKIKGADEAFSNQLAIESKFEKAIATVLGEFVDAVLIDAQKDIEDVIGLLGQKTSKVAILPISDVRPSGVIKVSKVSDRIFGAAVDLVSTTPEYQPIVDLLLGQVIVVNRREDAVDVLKGKKNHVRAVTLSGEVYFAGGAILVDTGAEAGTISRPRVRKELSDKIKSTERKIIKIDKQINQLAEEILKIESRKSKLDSKIDDLQDVTEQKRLALNIAKSKADSLKQQIDWHEKQIDAIDVEILNSTKERELADEVTAENLQLIDSLKNELKAASQKVKNISTEEQQKQFAHWQAQQTAIARSLKDAEDVYQDRKTEKDRIQDQWGLLKNEKNQIEEKLQAIKQNIVEMRSSEGGIGGKISELQEFITPAEKDLLKAEEDYSLFLEEEAKSRQTLGIAERHHAQAQIALTKSQEALDTLKERIEYDFGLVDFEYTNLPGQSPLPFSDIVERLPVVTEITPDVKETMSRQRTLLRRMGAVNPDAEKEYHEVDERYHFMTEQVEDLEAAQIDLKAVISELDTLMDVEFRKTFDVVAKEFKEIFTRLFGGGSANLILNEGEELNDFGVDIEAKLPGKKTQQLASLSGGERSLTAAALVFSLIKASPTPFVVLDEVDAALDEANVGRFRDILRELASETQFVVITHNRTTVQAADVIYGITMGRDTTSQSISLKLENVDEKYTY